MTTGAGSDTLGAWLERRSTLLMLVLFAANLALKLPGMTSQGLWFDEAFSIQNAQQPIDIGRQLATDASPPLYGFVLALWVRAFGGTLEGARSLSVVLSSATAVLLFAWGRRFVGAEAGVIGALLFTVARVQLFFAQEARGYALVGLLCTASFFAFLALFRSASRRAAIALALLNATLLYTHYIAGLALLAQLIAALAARRSTPQAFRLYVASQIATALLFLPYAVQVALHWPPPMSGWATPPSPERLLLVPELFAGSRGLLAVDFGLIALAALLLRRGRARSDDAGSAGAAPSAERVLLLWLLVPLVVGYVVSQVVPIFLHRYLLFASIALYLLVGRAVSLLPIGAWLRAVLVAGLAALSLLALWRQPLSRPDWRGAVAIVRESSRPGSVAVVSPPYQLLPFGFHFSPAAFAEPPRMVDRLAAEGVLALPLATATGVAPRLDANRIVLAVSEEFAPLPPDVVPALADAGFALTAERRLDRVVVLVLDRRD